MTPNGAACTSSSCWVRDARDLWRAVPAVAGDETGQGRDGAVLGNGDRRRIVGSILQVQSGSVAIRAISSAVLILGTLLLGWLFWERATA